MYLGQQIVEGYVAPAGTTGTGADSPWLADLRREMRREAIKGMARERLRVANHSYGAQRDQSTLLGRIGEAVVIGLSVTGASLLLQKYLVGGGAR